MHASRYITYIMASPTRTLYIGVTNDIYLRVAQHKVGINPKSFTSQYGCKKLVFCEIFYDPTEAIAREKRLKKWSRVKKINLISKQNPHWRDLSETWILPDAVPYDSNKAVSTDAGNDPRSAPR